MQSTSWFGSEERDGTPNPQKGGRHIVQFLPEENEIRTINGVRLTSHRLWREVESSSHKEVKTIMLEDLCSCVLNYHANPIWLVLAIAAALVGLVASTNRQYGI